MGRRKFIALVASLATVTTLGGLITAAGSASGVRAVRGFDGTTVKVASIGIKAQLPGVETGAKARIKRFNDTNEIKGVKIDYAEFVDDKQDPATTLSEMRRLVTQEQVFAIVGDVSQSNPGDYMKAQHVPYFGWAFDNTYCSNSVDKTMYGFGFNGCLVPSDPKLMPDTGKLLYQYVSQKTGKKRPTAALFSTDSQSGKNSTKFQAASYQGAGFKIVYADGQIPLPPVTDYTPYVQQLLTADNGKAPDALVCLLASQCFNMFDGTKAANYQGVFLSSFASDVLVKPMAGAVANNAYVWPSESTPGVTQMKADINAVSPGAAIDSGVAAGYFSTDMFISALKTIAKKGKGNITPENLQQTALNQTWQIKGLAGPTKYPRSMIVPTPTCNTLLSDDGTAWKTALPFTCSTKTFKITSK